VKTCHNPTLLIVKQM